MKVESSSSICECRFLTNDIREIIGTEKQKNREQNVHGFFIWFVAEKTRTSTPLRAPAPQAGASAISPLRRGVRIFQKETNLILRTEQA